MKKLNIIEKLVEENIEEVFEELEEVVKFCSEVLHKIFSEWEKPHPYFIQIYLNTTPVLEHLLKNLFKIDHQKYSKLWSTVDKHLLTLPIEDRNTFIRIYISNRIEKIKNEFNKFSTQYYSTKYWDLLGEDVLFP